MIFLIIQDIQLLSSEHLRIYADQRLPPTGGYEAVHALNSGFPILPRRPELQSDTGDERVPSEGVYLRDRIQCGEYPDYEIQRAQ